ncbi:MAG TPA: PAS domain S-box protein [Methanobacteriaceae archaeon]|nr:PAS domain S-box protein [Methanobacteriaceae archaeon]
MDDHKKEALKKQKKSDENSLLGFEEKYSALFNSDPTYKIIINLDGKIIDINEQAAQISSSRDEIIGKNFTELKQIFGEGEDPKKYKEILSLVLAGIDVEPVEITIKDKSGSNKWLELYPSLLEKEGVPVLVQIVAQDVTARKEAEIQLEFQSYILKNVQNPVVVTDLDGKIIYWNAASESTFGYTSEEVEGDSMAIIFPNITEDVLLKILKGQVRRKGSVEYQCQKKAGPLLWMQISINPQLDYKGDVLGYISVFNDITSIKMVEDELKESLSEKEMLLGEINKRLKNYMQMIARLLELQSIYLENVDGSATLHEGQNRLKAMLLIHEGLSKSDDLAIIDFTRFVNKLKKQLMGIYDLENEEVNLKARLDGIMLDVDTAIPCGLIVNELLTQSFKNAVNGRVLDMNLTLGLDNSGHYKLRYEDTSEGLSGGLITENSDSMIIIRTLVNQIEGDMKISPNHPVVEISWFNPEYSDLS